MLLNRRDAAWGWVTLLASAAAVLLYIGVFHPAAQCPGCVCRIRSYAAASASTVASAIRR